jgi:hypothetical protein
MEMRELILQRSVGCGEESGKKEIDQQKRNPK